MRIPVSTRFTLRTGGKSFRDAVRCLPGGRGGNERLVEATPVHSYLVAWEKKGQACSASEEGNGSCGEEPQEDGF